MYTSKSAHACPSAVTRAANTQVTQFSTLPVTPGVLRRDARGGPSLLAGERSRRSRSLARSGHPGHPAGTAPPGPASAPRSSSHDHLYLPEQGLHPVRPLVPGRLSQLPAVRPRSPRQRPHVIQRRRDAAPLPHHPAQHPADQRIRSLPALGGIFYAGHCGRGRLLFFHKIQERATAAPRCTPASRNPAGTADRSRHALSRQPHDRRSRNRKHQSTQRETATVIHGRGALDRGMDGSAGGAHRAGAHPG